METLIQQYQANIDKIKGLTLGDKLNFKAADTVLTTNIDEPTLIQAQGLGYIGKKAQYGQSVLDYFPKVAVNSHVMVLANEVDVDGAPDVTNEGAEKPATDFDINVKDLTFSKYASHIRVSAEMVEDISFMQRMIDNNLRRRLKDKIATDFISGLAGATGTLTNGGLTSGTTGTLIKDILPAVTADLQTTNGYTPNLWMLSNANYGKMFAEAGTNFLWYAMNDPKVLVADMGANILGLDTTMFPLYVYKDLSVTIGMINDDLTKNTMTMVVEARIAWNFDGECLNAIYNDSIADTLNAIA